MEHLEPQAKFEAKAARRRERTTAANVANGSISKIKDKERAASPSPRSSPQSESAYEAPAPSTISLPAPALLTQTATNSAGASTSISPHPASGGSSRREGSASPTTPTSPAKQPVLGLHSHQSQQAKIDSMLHRIPYFIVIFTPQSTDNYGRSVGMQKISALQQWEQDRATGRV